MRGTSILPSLSRRWMNYKTMNSSLQRQAMYTDTGKYQRLRIIILQYKSNAKRRESDKLLSLSPMRSLWCPTLSHCSMSMQGLDVCPLVFKLLT